MRERNLRTRIATGSFTLPVAAVATALLWIGSALTDEAAWTGLLLTGAVTYMLVELNNRNALLRERSRMVSTVYLAFMAGSPFLHPWSPAMLPAAAMAAAYFPLFAAYQSRRAAARVFNAALLLSLGSLVYAPLLLLLVGVFLSLGLQLRALSGRTFMALILGGAAPYWLFFGWAIWQHDLPWTLTALQAMFSLSPPDYATLSLPELVVGGYVALLSLVAVIHFFRTAYNDKIRTRMYFYTLILVEAILAAAIALQPQRADVLLRLLMVNSAPLVAHHLTLARGRWANAWFAICLLGLAAVIVLNTVGFHASHH